MSKWPDIPLAEIAKPVNRPVAVVPGQSYRTIGVKWWGEGAYERETIDGSRTAAKTLSVVREGDLIINKIWVRHGSTAIAGANVDGCSASGEFPTFNLDRERVLPEWIHWQTKTRGFWSKCDALSRGTSGKNRIKPELFLTIPVPIPPVAEQRRVLSRIEELAAQIHEARTLRHQAAEEAEALTARAAAEIFNEDFPKARLGNVSELINGDRGKNYPNKAEYVQEGVPWINTGHIEPDGSLSLRWMHYITREKFDSLRSGKVQPGDLVYCLRGATLGKTAIITQFEEGAVASSLVIIRPSAELDSRFAYWFLISPLGREQIFRFDNGSAQPNLSANSVKKYWMPLPPLAEQRRMVAELDGLQAEADALKRLQVETAAELDALLPAILDRAFKGEL